MLDVFLKWRKQEVLGDEGGELLQVELRHMLGETHEALSPVVLERADGSVTLGFLGVEHDEGDEPPRRHSRNMIMRPVLPLPSRNGWMRS